MKALISKTGQGMSYRERLRHFCARMKDTEATRLDVRGVSGMTVDQKAKGCCWDNSRSLAESVLEVGLALGVSLECDRGVPLRSPDCLPKGWRLHVYSLFKRVQRHNPTHSKNDTW